MRTAIFANKVLGLARTVGLLGLGVALSALALAGCSRMAVWSAPEKTARPESAEARRANDDFWRTFHGGHYQKIDPLLNTLTGAYLTNPHDALTAAHIGFVHIWRLSEVARLDEPRATITDDLVLARKYFAEAVRLDPSDARYLGFLGGLEMAEGSVHDDEKLTRQGYFRLHDARDAWPEFNLFTLGYGMSRLPATDAKYGEALDAQWKTLDLCAEEKVDRTSGDFSRYMAKETHEGPKRACWNSWIAPHNFEGFFLNMGDMVVKDGHPEIATKVYAQARLAKSYDRWPYKDVLEERIVQAAENVAVFRAPRRPGEKRRALMIETAFSCMACHQASPSAEATRASL